MRSPLFEIALVLVRFDHAASMIWTLESRRHAALIQVHAARDWNQGTILLSYRRHILNPVAILCNGLGSRRVICR